jgi:hypothetical protein
VGSRPPAQGALALASAKAPKAGKPSQALPDFREIGCRKAGRVALAALRWSGQGQTGAVGSEEQGLVTNEQQECGGELICLRREAASQP